MRIEIINTIIVIAVRIEIIITNSYSNDNGGWQTGNLGSRQRMAPLNLTVSLITGALTVIFSDPPWNDCNARFTTVP